MEKKVPISIVQEIVTTMEASLCWRENGCVIRRQVNMVPPAQNPPRHYCQSNSQQRWGHRVRVHTLGTRPRRHVLGTRTSMHTCKCVRSVHCCAQVHVRRTHCREIASTCWAQTSVRAHRRSRGKRRIQDAQELYTRPPPAAKFCVTHATWLEGEKFNYTNIG